MQPTPDEFAAAGLYDPEGSDAVERLELLRWLADEGFSVPEMQAAQEALSLPNMAGDRWLVPGRRLTRDEAVERTGLDPELFDACSTALGLVPIQGSPEGDVVGSI